LVLFNLAICFNPKGSSSGLQLINTEKERYKIALAKIAIVLAVLAFQLTQFYIFDKSLLNFGLISF
jgi:hypothetical protein